MNLLKILETIYSLVENFLRFQKKEQIIDAKNKALETGDQRELEKVLSPVDNSVNNDKYPGMYERTVKKKS